jgi:hypothetical protein
MPQPLARNGYTEDQVRRALLALLGTRTDRYKYELVDSAGNKMRDLSEIIKGTPRWSHHANDPKHGQYSLSILDLPLLLAPYSNVVLADSPLFYLKMREAAGTTADDASSNNRDGMYNGTAGTHYQLAQAGLLEGDSADLSVRFFGNAAGFTSIPSNAAYNFTGGFALEMPFRTAQTAQGFLFQRDNGTTQRQIYVEVTSAGLLSIRLFFSDATDVTLTSVARVNDDKRHVLRVLYDKSKVLAYVDYGLVIESAQTKQLRSVTQDIHIGKSFNGFLAHVSYYGSSLPVAQTPQQSRLHYQAAVRDLQQFNPSQDEIKIWAGPEMPDGGVAWFAQGVYGFQEVEWVRAEANFWAVSGFDRSFRLEDKKFPARRLFEAGENIIEAVRTLLDEADIPQHNIESSALTLRADTEFARGSDYLAAINILLAAANYYALDFDWDGVAVSKPNVLLAIRQADWSFPIRPGSKLSHEQSMVGYNRRYRDDYLDTPNWFYIYTGSLDGPNLFTERFNDDLSSPASRPNRNGRTVGPEPVQVEAADQPTLELIADRILEERSRVSTDSDFPIYGQFHLWHKECLDVPDYIKQTRYKFLDNGWERAAVSGAVELHRLAEGSRSMLVGV